jgi:carbon-monoxide dehydrogenase medium subunit
VPEAATTLAELGGDATVLAGGQSLIPALAMRLGQPEALVDINRIAELAVVERSNGTVSIGATVRQQKALVSDELRTWCPLLVEALPHVGVRETRSRGTVVGSIAHADPAAELLAVAVALDGEVVLRHGDEIRVVPAAEFVIAPFMTTRAPGELMTALRLPVSSPAMGWAFVELARGPFALVAVAAGVELDALGRVVDARLAFAGAAPAPARAREAEALLIGAEPGADVIAEAAQSASRELDPASDILASASYRRHVARELACGALIAAARRAGEK